MTGTSRWSTITAFLLVGAGTAIGVAWAGCSDDGSEEPVTVAGGPTSLQVPVDVEAEHGGTVVVAGRYPVEVVAHRSGEVFAYVLTPDEPPDDATLTVDVPVVGRSSARPLRLRWNEVEARYEGRLRSLEVAPGPLEVHFDIDGRVHQGRVATVVVAPAIAVEVGSPAPPATVRVEAVEPSVEVRVVEPRVRVRRKHKHKHMRRKHRRRGGAGIEIRF